MFVPHSGNHTTALPVDAGVDSFQDSIIGFELFFEAYGYVISNGVDYFLLDPVLSGRNTGWIFFL